MLNLHQIFEMIKKNIFTILVALIIMYLSLANSDTFDKIPLVDVPDFDKVVHLVMYFGLMSVIILENRKTIKSTVRLFLVGVIPFLYGVLMEILQATLTVTRSGSFYDALADAAGVLLSILLWLRIKRIKNIK
jgi:VanZ family protein